MVPGGSDLSYAEDRGTVSGGAWLIWFQCYIRVISLVQKGRDYSEEDQRNLDRGSSPKRRMALCHLCQRGRDNHIDVIDVYWWERLIWRDSHIDYWCRACLVYMLTSIICNWCLVIGIDINVSIAINAKGGDCWIMLSLMPMVCHWCQWFDYLGDCWIICHWCKWFGLIDVIGWCQVIDLYDSLDENVICPSGNQSMQR